jgi:hypothetical protein
VILVSGIGIKVQIRVAIHLLPSVDDLRIVLLQRVEVAFGMQILPEVPGVPVPLLWLAENRGRHNANPKRFLFRRSGEGRKTRRRGNRAPSEFQQVTSRERMI